MKLIKIDGIERVLHLEPGKIIEIEIENYDFYKKILLTSFYQEPIMTYSEQYNIKDIYKNGLFLFDITQVNPNEKKMLTMLYTKASKFINDSDKIKLHHINSSILEILENISFDFNYPLKFNYDLDITKLLSIYNFSYNIEDKYDFLKLFIYYLKAKMDIGLYSFVITFDFLKFFSLNEQEILKRELEFLNITLIDIRKIYIDSIISNEKIVIDKDFCEI